MREVNKKINKEKNLNYENKSSYLRLSIFPKGMKIGNKIILVIESLKTVSKLL